jgi:hypothetical protein
MPIVIQPSYIIYPDQTTTAGAIIGKASQDCRQLLSNSGTDANTILDYVDRIHKELLRLSRFRWLLSPVKQFTTVVGKTDYWIGQQGQAPATAVDTALNLTDVFTIKRGTVFDRTNYMPIFPTSEAPLGAFFAQNNRPRLWRNDVATGDVINVYPPPDGAYVIEFRYFRERQLIASPASVLQVPDQYIDVVIAGVNELVAMYLRKPDEAGYWHQYYESGKKQIIRDSNLFPRGPEFVRPDPYMSIGNLQGGLPTEPIETSIP